jgi:hypothetical protein
MSWTKSSLSPFPAKRFISEFNEIINENVNNAEVRKLLAERRIAVASGTKGNKLLSAVYESILGDTENLVEPFFYLYDRRRWADHSMGDDLLNEVAAKLGVPPNDYQRLMETLVAAINTSADKLLDRVEA